MSNKNNWKDKVQFFAHGKNLVHGIKGELTVIFKGINDSLNQADKSVMNLFVDNNSLNDMIGKELKVEMLSSVNIKVEDRGHNFNHQFWNIDLKIDGESVKVDDLLKEIKYKDATQECKDLFDTKLIDGNYFEFGKSAIKKYYLQDEEHFFEFQSLFHKNQFSLPDDPVLRKDLEQFIEKDTPGASKYIMENLPTLSERESMPQPSVKRIKVS